MSCKQSMSSCETKEFHLRNFECVLVYFIEVLFDVIDAGITDVIQSTIDNHRYQMQRRVPGDDGNSYQA